VKDIFSYILGHYRCFEDDTLENGEMSWPASLLQARSRN